MIPQLKPEILSLIFEHLLPPLPKRHSYDVYDRSFMRQPDFFALLQASKTIYNIAAPTLYRVVVIGDLGVFLLCSGKGQRIPGIIPKSDLISQTRRLFIEYRSFDSYELKGVNRTIPEKGEINLSKRELQRRERDKSKDKWARKIIGLQPDFEVKCPVEGVLIQLGKELKMLQGATQELIGYPGRRKKPLFERLEKFSIGAFFGRNQEPPFFFLDEEFEETEEDLWEMLLDNKEYQKVLSEVKNNLSLFLSQTPSIKHFCQSPTDAALGITNYLPKDNETRPSIAYHTDARYITNLPTAVGIPFTQYVHSTQWVNGKSDDLFHKIERSFLGAVEHRKSIFKDVKGHLSPPSNAFNGQGNDCTMPLPKSAKGKAEWRAETDWMELALSVSIDFFTEEDMPEELKVKDKLSIKPIFDAVPCQACGWEFDEERYQWY